MNGSIITDFLSGQATSTQWAGLCLVGGVLFVAILVNLRDQREESRGRK
jgi:hypothetical protein